MCIKQNACTYYTIQGGLTLLIGGRKSSLQADYRGVASFQWLFILQGVATFQGF